MMRALREHWPEYLCEAAELGLFMISAGLFTILLHHPGSPVRSFVPSEFTRRMLTGIAMGSTAIGLVFSPFGKRSGAHFNPAVTLTFWRLGRVKNWDAIFYIVAQFVGGIAGVFAVTLFVREAIAHPTVNFVATLPGMRGVLVAFIAEFVIAFVLMSVVLRVSNTPHLARYTGLFAGALVATYITLESPLSGMSMNPARTFGSAFVGHLWTGLWIYFTAPVLAMQLAAALYLRGKGVVYCAKYHHYNQHRCIFNCRFPELLEREQTRTQPRESASAGPRKEFFLLPTNWNDVFGSRFCWVPQSPLLCVSVRSIFAGFRRINWHDRERYGSRDGVLFVPNVSESVGRRSSRGRI